jgi:hypothetical protein
MARTQSRIPDHERVLRPLRRLCPACGGFMRIRYENRRTLVTLSGTLRLRLKIRRCEGVGCARHHCAYRPESESALALPQHEFGLDVIALVGLLRHRDHRSVPEIHALLQAKGVPIAERSVTNLLDRYDELVATSLTNNQNLRQRLVGQGRIILGIDGLQPDVGHEVLWVISDGQHSLRRAVAAALPGAPHQLCQFHFLREAAHPVFEADRHAKKELKKEVRGIRPIERGVEGQDDAEAKLVRGYGAAVRSAITDDGRTPLAAAGLKLEQRLEKVAKSLDRVAQKGAARSRRGSPSSSD